MSQDDTLKKLTPRQAALIRELMVNRTVREAAEAVGISRRTAYRWLDLTQVRTALLAAEGRNVDRAAQRLGGLAGAAIDALADLLSNPGQDGGPVKRLTACAILEHLERMTELRRLSEIENRLTQLEASRHEEKHNRD